MTTPYHPKEIGVTNPKTESIATGIVGVLTMLAIVVAAILATIVCAPFILMGLAEVISTGDATQYRVRWIRRS